jgi:hydrogenase maturation protein HypF
VDRVRRRIRVEGIVQGVGFRPYVYALATRLGLAGWVGNDTDGVFIEVEGGPETVARFEHDLPAGAPPLAVLDRVLADAVAARGDGTFTIVDSVAGGPRQALISPDTATCDDCLRELSDPRDRRYRYPFINCTNCGPRFTIVTGVPYDRPYTTMAGFRMCADCAREYRDPTDRRFHAQPVCCPACGPRLALLDRHGATAGGGDPVAAAADLLRAGRILAVKGLGGYHLAVDAAREAAVAALRARKHREERAFAVMVADVATARRLCHVDDVEARVLAGPHRPIVLLRRRAVGRVDGRVAPQVAPGNGFLGLMLPYTPLHHLLAAAFGEPFVLTSGNLSDEPIAYDDADASARLAGIADFFLTHDRPVHMRTDDSVVRVFAGRLMPVRRSRGYVPRPVGVPTPFRRPVLACGAELKNTFCLGKARHLFVSHHIGDLENHETYRSFVDGIAHFRRLFDVTPEVIAHDLHPEYLSTKYAAEFASVNLPGVDLVGVQHHHAHIASCLVDNGWDDRQGTVLGVAFDGLGFGTDGTLWGGEFLVAGLRDFVRVARLAPVPMPGGAAAIREPWRMAAAYLDAAYGDDVPADLVRHPHWRPVAQMARRGVNAPLTSSAGRLFDAVAAILGIRQAISYEGQAAIELEQCADPAERAAYPLPPGPELSGVDLVRAVVEDLARGVAVPRIAARFHNGLAAAVVATAVRVRDSHGTTTVALSGGVFQNLLLLGRVVDGLADAGFRVLTHHQVPTNDGGISVGQAAIAGARDRARRPPGPDAP